MGVFAAIAAAGALTGAGLSINAATSSRSGRAGPAELRPNRKLEIYDSDEPVAAAAAGAAAEEVVVVPETSMIKPWVTVARVTVTNAYGAVTGVFDGAARSCSSVKRRVNAARDFVPPSERSVIGLAVMGLAAAASSFTFPKRPLVRRLLVVPAAVSFAASVCYPRTITKTVLRARGVVGPDEMEFERRAPGALERGSAKLHGAFDRLVRGVFGGGSNGPADPSDIARSELALPPLSRAPVTIGGDDDDDSEEAAEEEVTPDMEAMGEAAGDDSSSDTSSSDASSSSSSSDESERSAAPSTAGGEREGREGQGQPKLDGDQSHPDDKQFYTTRRA